MTNWIDDAVFYHIYPLGLCGAPQRNDFKQPVVDRLNILHEWLPHIESLGANVLYLGPVFEASAHGYDTVDYFQVDRRLGTNEGLGRFSATLHQKGIRLVLDGVFNHVGRDFWAFKDVQTHREASAYRDWFSRLDFNQRSPYGDQFSYEGWSGHYDLVKLNLANPAVRAYLFEAIGRWIEQFQLDGLRLDAADALDLDFIEELAKFCRQKRPDFWLMGEVVHGDYRHWANPTALDATTNYEAYKGLYSSHLAKNYFELAYTLNRQFGPNGIYRDLRLYNFADNHDVNRVASSLTNPAQLYPLYVLLFTMPGLPSIYYGSEWGITGQRNSHDDAMLRPGLKLAEAQQTSPQPALAQAIQHLSQLRHSSSALKQGDYRQLLVNHEQLAFIRTSPDEQIVVAVNAADKPATVELDLSGNKGSGLIDLLNDKEKFSISNNRVQITLWPTWARVMRLTEAV